MRRKGLLVGRIEKGALESYGKRRQTYYNIVFCQMRAFPVSLEFCEQLTWCGKPKGRLSGPQIVVYVACSTRSEARRRFSQSPGLDSHRRRSVHVGTDRQVGERLSYVRSILFVSLTVYGQVGGGTTVTGRA